MLKEVFGILGMFSCWKLDEISAEIGVDTSFLIFPLIYQMYICFVFVSPDYELIVDSDILPNRTVGSAWPTGGFETQEPAQFEERHLIFLQLLGKVQSMLSCVTPFPLAVSLCIDFYSCLIKFGLHDSGQTENNDLSLRFPNKNPS